MSFTNSINKNLKGIIIILIASILTAIGQLFWKIATSNNSFILIILGFICYGIGALLLIVAFKFGSYSVIHPFLCTGYIFAVFLGFYFLNESLSFLSLIGIVFIIIGVLFIGGGDH